jgi:hypothetical protein
MEENDWEELEITVKSDKEFKEKGKKLESYIN